MTTDEEILRLLEKELPKGTALYDYEKKAAIRLYRAAYERGVLRGFNEGRKQAAKKEANR